MKYIKPTYVPDNAPPTPPTDQAEVSIAQPVQAQMPQPLGTAFSGEDAKALLRVAQDISNVHPSQKAESWQTWATAVSVFHKLISAYANVPAVPAALSTGMAEFLGGQYTTGLSKAAG